MRGISTFAGLSALAIACWVEPGPAMAQDKAAEDLRQADERTFASADLNKDGKITRGEVVHFVDFVFLSVDSKRASRRSSKSWT